jgi:hypothetical protein
VNDAPFEPRALQIGNHYKLANKAALRAIASQESPLLKGFFKKLFIRIKPA